MWIPPQQPICNENLVCVKYTGYVMPKKYLYMEIVNLSAASEQQ